MDPIADTLNNAERKILLSLKGEEDVEDIARRLGYGELVEAMSPISWLSRKGLVEIKERVEYAYSLTERGEKVLKRGLPEAQALDLVKGGIAITEFRDELGKDASIAIGWLKNEGCEIEGGKFIVDEAKICDLRERVSQELEALGNPDEGAYELLGGRGLVRKRAKSQRRVALTEMGERLVKELGKEREKKRREEINQLTPEIIKSGEWRKLKFRSYDVKAHVPTPRMGKRHLLTLLIDQVRDAFLKMGFTEIRGDYVVSSFWDMDVLFIPQDHPARDLQDTFYVDRSFDLDSELLHKVKRIHEDGGDTGSDGWGYSWSEEEAKKALLRTHTTIETIRYLSNHPKGPVKIFSVDKIFRKEAIDSKHLPEFNQIEGVVMEKHADFRELLGVFKQFYSYMGFEVRFRPSYFPYTEPSLEIQIQKDGEWIELGGSGIFRPEVLAPFGIKENVLAWGLGLERLGMIVYDLKDIRGLYTNDVDELQSFPLRR